MKSIIDEELEELFAFKWNIDKWTNEELEQLTTKEDTTEEVIISLKVNIPRDKGGVSYYLIPLVRVPVISFLNEFMDEDGITDDLSDMIELMMMSTMSFLSRTTWYLLEHEGVKEVLSDMLSKQSFEHRHDLIMDFAKNYLVKTMCEICKKVPMFSEEFMYEEMEYAHESGIYENYINSINSIIDKIYLSEALQNNIESLQTVLNNTFEEATLQIENIDLSLYESIINKKVPLQDMLNTIMHIKDLFLKVSDSNKALGQFKTKNHPLSFLYDDRVVDSKYTNKPIFERLLVGLINASVSEGILSIIDKTDKKKYEENLETLKKFKVGIEKIELAEELIYLCDSIKYRSHIPTIAISNAYFGLSVKQTLSLSKFLLPSINKNTVFKHYPDLFHLQVNNQIVFAD
ncbi:hypothetical protein [Sulfurovum mangrovi]|uniref:hypothetical protein n=1 Tax=Sulfurovum mangrovi TaxID=2893889 RepID=UPI001E2E93EA|nr:hypothetical protein [Sulfurovum mangrovi]UFH60479.1 hypothetical protein LN246_06375 [Sulfurovum mangrovi]